MKFIMLSHERSGSHLLGDYIATLSDVARIDEVCNPATVSPIESPRSFHRFKYEWLVSERDAALMASYSQQCAFVSRYFDFLHNQSGRRKIVVDIKYGHVHNFEWVWNPPFRRPLLFHVAQTDGIGILHLFRHNVLEAAVSAHLAVARQVWHSWEPGAATIAADKQKINVSTVIQHALLLREQNQWIATNWVGGAKYLPITYEDLVASLSAPANENCLSKISDFLKVAPKESFVPKSTKLARPLPEAVANYDELCLACERAGLADFLSR